MGKTLIFTDLDGTLLDHEDYGFEPAVGALAQVRQKGIPIILCSSKTGSEIRVLQEALDLTEPYICENGAAVHRRVDEGAEPWKVFASPRPEVLECLRALRDEYGYAFRGFGDCSVAEISALTGLDAAQASLAASRQYSEPLQWRDSEERLAQFLQQLAAHGLQAQQGGRFLAVSSPCDKGAALQWVRQQYGGGGPVTTVALGDSPNDLDMLAMADIAIIIRSGRSDTMQLSGPAQVLRSQHRGPRGWQEVMGPLLESGALA